jgi:hypothetical protein
MIYMVGSEKENGREKLPAVSRCPNEAISDLPYRALKLED